jgi:cob(I)alamin adenosyltransferase
MIKKRLGLIHIYTGEGKGKTTAAMGLALRAVGQGLNVSVIQFLKGGSYTGEFIAIKNFLPKEKIDIKQFGKRCVKEVKQFKLIGIEHGFNKEECKYFDYVREDINCGDCRECFLDDEEQKHYSTEALKHAFEILSSEKYDLVVLDEINNSLFKGFISINDVVSLVQKKAPHTELILTGRHAPKEIIEMADLVTEMKNVKHYYDDGIKARRGIEY